MNGPCSATGPLLLGGFLDPLRIGYLLIKGYAVVLGQRDEVPTVRP